VKLWNCVVLALLILVWHGVLSLCGFYQSKRLSTKVTLMLDAVRASTLATVALVFAAWIFHIRMVNVDLVLVFWILSSLSIIIARISIAYLLGKIRRRGHNLRHVLILGTNSRAIEFAHRIESIPELGYRIVGFVDDEW